MHDLKENAKQFGIELTPDQVEKFQIFLEEILTWNETTNLTSITDPEEIVYKHFLDSLSVLLALPPTTETLVDIGTGAGFPSIPLKIVRPQIQMTLVDSVGKKITFVKNAINKFGLDNIEAVHTRAEEMGQNPVYREHFDVAVSRAVAELRVLCEYALPLVKIGGLVIAQKIVTQEEIDEAKNSLLELGARITKVITVTIPTLPDRHLVIITKTAATPEQFPRRPGIPSKRPL